MKILIRFFYSTKVVDTIFDDCFSTFFVDGKPVDIYSGKWIENDCFKFYSKEILFNQKICFFDKKSLEKGECILFRIDSSYYQYFTIPIKNKTNLSEIGLLDVQIQYGIKGIKLVNTSEKYTLNHQYFHQCNASYLDLLQVDDVCIYLLDHAIKINRKIEVEENSSFVPVNSPKIENLIPVFQKEELVLQPIEISLPIFSSTTLDYSSLFTILPMSLMLIINAVSMERGGILILISLLMPISMGMNLFIKVKKQKKTKKQELSDYLDYLEESNKQIELAKQKEREFLNRTIPDMSQKQYRYLLDSFQLYLGWGTRKSSLEITSQKVPYNKRSEQIYKAYQSIVSQSLLLEEAPIGIDVLSDCIVAGNERDLIHFCRTLIKEFTTFSDKGKLLLIVQKELLKEFSMFYYCNSFFVQGKRMIYTDIKEIDKNVDCDLCFSFMNINLTIPTFYYVNNTALIKKKVDRCITLQSRKGVLRTLNQSVSFNWNESETYRLNRNNLLSFNKMNSTMYSTTEQKIIDSFTNHHSDHSLSVVIGKNRDQEIRFDLHERVNGPHGLIAGTTGSGKTVFLISLILQFASHYRPDEVSFLLMDFKGGDLTKVFDNERYHLPHIAGSCTNLDSDLYRVECALQDELISRQKLMNKVKTDLHLPSMNIYEYQRYYHLKEVETPCPHLVIIIDEFAELKAQASDFMDYLIRVARIGRSLGIHLILSTQRPSGIINDQIRANMSFSICLKVSSEMDSKEVIGCNDAAFLKQPGEFYLQCNHDLVYGQNEYVYQDKCCLDEQKTVHVLNLQAQPVDTVQLNPYTGKTIFDETMAAILHVCDAYRFPGIQLWKPPLSDTYSYQKSLGVMDDPIHRRIIEFKPDLNKGLLVVGRTNQLLDSLLAYCNEKYDSFWIISEQKDNLCTNAVLQPYLLDNIHMNFQLLQNQAVIIDNCYEFLNNPVLRKELLDYQKRGNGLVILMNSSMKLSYELIHACSYRCLLESKDTNEMIQLFDEKVRIPFKIMPLRGIILTDQLYLIQMCSNKKSTYYNKKFTDFSQSLSFQDHSNIIGRSIDDFREIIFDDEITFVSSDESLLKRYESFFPKAKFVKPTLSLKLDTGVWLGKDYAYQKVFSNEVKTKDLTEKGVYITKEKTVVFYLLRRNDDYS